MNESTTIFIIHSTHYLFSDWPKAYGEFSKSAPGTSSGCKLYNNHVKNTQGNHVMCDRGAWFLRVITSSSRALCLPSVKKQKHWLPGLLRWPSKTRTHKTQKVDEGGKGAVCWLRKREKTERTWGKESVGTNFENILCRSEKERIRSMYNKTIIRFGFCDNQNNQGLGKGKPLPRPSVFWISQKHYPIIV